ncbi:MAG: 4-hydroxy-3-methylbut-2-enyl diphosphate reductase [Pseudomonadota bacterium]
MTLPLLTVLLADPRGFCAGVSRAIRIVERALEIYGAPIYVRHEIVHNRHVVDRLAALGAVFVHELDEIPPDSVVIFSAHGVPKSVPEQAKARALIVLDATCPLVSKVHVEAMGYDKKDIHVVLIGHAGHPEVEGTMGQVPDGSMTLVESLIDVARLTFSPDQPLAYVTQTTLSVDDTQVIIDALRVRYPHIKGPSKQDICYATTNRQAAVKTMAPRCDGFVVIGAYNSSNSMRLVEVAKTAGCANAQLITEPAQLTQAWLSGVTTLGVTAGASAPEVLVQRLLARLRNWRTVRVQDVQVASEDVDFKIPASLREPPTPVAISSNG